MANANYLPVLLQSVTTTATTAVPDDSYVNDQPRGQVDYLSHEWQEEDVWKSWRNMTRQKNEIANGVRLENASWRTWWKQRNKLKTVSPETLNWLKDSDVTWLYGPLHTSAEEKPPPKLPSVTERGPSPTTLGHQKPLHKPILKHRSISQRLTSDLPTSPIFSPAESEDEEEDLHSPLSDPRHDISPSQHPSFPKRPTLLHTKSDTHITRWGPNRAFRKDSPPRIDPPGQHDVDGYFPAVSVQASQSQDSSSSSNGERAAKKKHITFNTFVEQCIAIDKPKRSGSFCGEFGRSFDDDDGYEEDQEDSPEDDAEVTVRWGGSDESDSGEEEDGVIEMRTSYRSDKPKKQQNPRSQSKASNTSSSSSLSTASSTTANSSLSAANPSHKPAQRRPSNTSTYRPRPAPSHVTIAPIAPTVLKTTGAWEEGFGDDGAGSDDGFGWRERVWVYDGKKPKNRRSSSDNLSSEGTPVELVYVPPFSGRYAYEYDLDQYDDGPIGFEDEEGYEEEDIMEEDFVSRIANTSDEVFHHRGSVIGSVGFEDFSGSPDPHSSIPIPIPSNHLPDDAPTVENHETLDYAPQLFLEVPKVVVDTTQRDEDRFGSFDGPDLGEEYMHLGSSGSRHSYRSRPRSSDDRPSRSVSRTASSRSRSKSRTPSPNVGAISASVEAPLNSSTATLRPSRPEMRRANSSQTSPTQEQPSASSPRGRSQSHQDLFQASRSYSSSQSSSRGRSSTRTPSSSTLDSSTSPLGSLSPDASISPGRVAAGAYVGNGRLRAEKDSNSTGRRGRDESSGGGRDRGRGRSQTTDKRLSVSLSNSPEPPRHMDERVIAVIAPAPAPPPTPVSPSISRASSGHAPTEASCDSTSSVSSTKTIVPVDHQQKEEEEREVKEAEMRRLVEEELRRRTTPTPSNSPIVEMRSAIPNHLRVASSPPKGSFVSSTKRSMSPASTTGDPRSSSKTRPPPLVPSPPITSPPSTNSYTAISSPTSPRTPRRISATVVVSSPLPPQSHSAGVEDAVRPALHRSPNSDSSIIGKAADMVSSAGAFLGFWNHQHH